MDALAVVGRDAAIVPLLLRVTEKEILAVVIAAYLH
jgi:hypothetical protein